ncbi:hypothetical protein C8A00DRAFT_46906 [Chaetomidium leptoderma]|uniref:PRISE-like Rossmann-fold domain-containing protein n=1 Tax=Chaetomidium leptoderma TaxID=669021 RepID=A0AAN6VDT5_9PEZI|nr:hypothetical protein C8A00DRAFT_46906 [Chaetomidium leptoderma]
MLLFQGLREYERSSPWPEKSSILIQLKHNLSLMLDVPNFGVVASTGDEADAKASLTRVVLAHAAFKAAMRPDLPPDDAFFKTCAAEVNVISLFFPDVKTDTIRIAFAAWLAFACVMDDILESLDDGVRELALGETIEVLKCAPASPPQRVEGTAPTANDKRVQVLARVLFDHVTRYLPEKSAQAFFEAVRGVLGAHVEEIHFYQGRHADSFPKYMSIRCRTIALNPFFENLQNEVSRVAGLQNDLIGLVRDLEDGEQLNGVMVLMRGCRGYNKDQLDHDILSRCVAMANAEHNQSASRCFEYMAQLHRAAEASGCSEIERVEKVARHIIMMCETHLRWCSSAKRYRLEVGVNGSRPEQGQPDSNTQSQPARTQPAETQLVQRQPTKIQSTPPQRTMVQSSGIFHGLPTFPDTPECRGMTALVTGATGLSGYHMVKTLAASPQRWRKIYCLSSRPPPENFFADLGDGANRVEHLAVDFLDDPSDITQRLKYKIQHVDHIFYFSYVQPAPKGDMLDLWANADELAAVNATIFTNFISALQQTTIKPKRFMLQTGSKHYAFYLGPASLPAFESDPRVLLDRNFYYEQEDTLADYCQSVGAAWNVARPSYIVGAVRDGTLNHLIGFGIYAAVQAHLGQSIAFPGDYRAWDREQVQSTGLLNACFEEWLVLTEKAANEAFNIHDGLSFTWGRLWPYLAQWYNAEWSPPDEDEDKYRGMKLPYPKTPRGYGPQTSLRSTFSLFEWSLQPHVEQTWNALAEQHNLVLNPFDDRYRARIFSFSDSAVIRDTPMTTSVRKAREFGFFGTVDSYHSIFDTFHDLARLKLIPAPALGEFKG